MRFSDCDQLWRRQVVGRPFAGWRCSTTCRTLPIMVSAITALCGAGAANDPSSHGAAAWRCGCTCAGCSGDGSSIYAIQHRSWADAGVREAGQRLSGTLHGWKACTASQPALLR